MLIQVSVPGALLAAALMVQGAFIPNRLVDLKSITEGKNLAKTSSPTSNVKGKTFDRFVNIWLENTDYESAAADPNLQWLAKQGITLTNYHGVAHPSQPNYVAVVGGSQNKIISGLVGDIPKKMETIVDRLEAKGISWGEYQEGLPYTGFLGDFKNQRNGRNDYVRKHNPLASYLSITENPDRLSLIKNFTLFHQDLENNKLPQWMFITPNMTNDGHDSSVAVAGRWTRSFVEPLLKDKRFMDNTLVVLTFDESEKYTGTNRVFTVLFGDAVPASYIGLSDSTLYNHFSNLITVQRNWDLPKVLEAGTGEATANAFYLFNSGGEHHIQDNFGAVEIVGNVAEKDVVELGTGPIEQIGDTVKDVVKGVLGNL